MQRTGKKRVITTRRTSATKLIEPNVTPRRAKGPVAGPTADARKSSVVRSKLPDGAPAVDDTMTEFPGDAAPERIIDQSKNLLHSNIIDAEIAYETSGDAALIDVRAGGFSELLSFSTETMTLTVELEPDGRLAGRVFPPKPGRVILRHFQHGGATNQEVKVDEHGSFEILRVPYGSCQLVVENEAGKCKTPWFVV